MQEKDLELLRILEDNSRLSAKEIATMTNLTPTEVEARVHALEAAGGLTYSELGRYTAKDGDPKGTNDAGAAEIDPKTSRPVSNPTRDTWVTATALSTALNVSFMAYNLALFGTVVGIALFLSGVGFIILAVLALGRPVSGAAPADPPANEPPATA